MPFYSIFEQRDTRWILRESDPREVAFPTNSPLASWSLLSTLVVLPPGFSHAPVFAPLGDGRCLVCTTRLDFRTPSIDLDAAAVIVVEALRWLRYVSGQSGLGTKIIAHESYPDGAYNMLSAPYSAQAQVAVVHHAEASALRFDRIDAALQAESSMNVPVYAEILFDAIEAEAVGDYRKAILYSAIAVEAMAGTRIDEMHDRDPNRSCSDSRRGPSRGSGGDAVGEDPVFAQLRRDARRSFKLLLHELPLYVIQRSLLREDENLYRELAALHKTRNDLAHTGVVDGADKLPTDYPGAKRALAAAIRAYDWFKASGRYVTMHGHQLNI